MLEDDSRTPNRLKPTQNENICKMLNGILFGDTILHGGVTRFRTQPTSKTARNYHIESLKSYLQDSISGIYRKSANL